MCVVSVAGVRLTRDPLHDVISRLATHCADDSTDCYLVDDGAIVVYVYGESDNVRNISWKKNKTKQVDLLRCCPPRYTALPV